MGSESEENGRTGGRENGLVILADALDVSDLPDSSDMSDLTDGVDEVEGVNEAKNP